MKMASLSVLGVSVGAGRSRLGTGEKLNMRNNGEFGFIDASFATDVVLSLE